MTALVIRQVRVERSLHHESKEGNRRITRRHFMKITGTVVLVTGTGYRPPTSISRWTRKNAWDARAVCLHVRSFMKVWKARPRPEFKCCRIPSNSFRTIICAARLDSALSEAGLGLANHLLGAGFERCHTLGAYDLCLLIPATGV